MFSTNYIDPKNKIIIVICKSNIFTKSTEKLSQCPQFVFWVVCQLRWCSCVFPEPCPLPPLLKSLSRLVLEIWPNCLAQNQDKKYMVRISTKNYSRTWWFWTPIFCVVWGIFVQIHCLHMGVWRCTKRFYRTIILVFVRFSHGCILLSFPNWYQTSLFQPQVYCNLDQEKRPPTSQ